MLCIRKSTNSFEKCGISFIWKEKKSIFFIFDRMISDFAPLCVVTINLHNAAHSIIIDTESVMVINEHITKIFIKSVKY